MLPHSPMWNAGIAQLVEHDLAKVGGREFESRLPLIIKRNIQNIILMNLYIRYFDNEVLVHSVDEALDFLSSIPDIQLTPELEDDIRNYASNGCFLS